LNCGTVSDGCGTTIDCGTCPVLQTCGGGGTANRCGCTPKTCDSLGARCGIVQDGCGGIVTCPACGHSRVCLANQCVKP
jgi:hypothetical protein